MTDESTLYVRVGGEQWFVELGDRFYERVEADPVLRPLYPEDLTESRAHLAAFLVQYWGGPTTYSDERGHPRLRMRHVRWEIGPEQSDAWYRHMASAVRSGGLSGEDESAVLEYFDMAARHLRNV